MREGSLEAPTRRPVDWQNRDFHDADKLDAEMRRVFDVCHGCRRCFNLCDAFPRLFDLIDCSPSGELDTVDSGGFAQVVGACTLCDMCFVASCPYVPPHEFNIDFAKLMLRYRAVEQRRGAVKWAERALARTDRNGKAARFVAPLVKWATDTRNGPVRLILERIAGVHREAALPGFHRRTFLARARRERPALNREAPAFGRKAVLFATCFVNYSNPRIGLAARAVLARNGVETEVVYPGCCGMPQLEQGDLAAVAARAVKAAHELGRWIDDGYTVISLVPSCALMLKLEWPLMLPDDSAVRHLSANTRDISEYVVDIAKNERLAPGLRPLPGGVTLHLACHARAQNMGPKAAEMLRLIPDADVAVVERCSGHGGSWGVKANNFEVALKVGKPVARQVVRNGKAFLASECPLAATHIVQGMERLDQDPVKGAGAHHPIELVARAYGLSV